MDVLQMRARMSLMLAARSPTRPRRWRRYSVWSARPTRSPTPPATSPRSSPRRSASPTRCAARFRGRRDACPRHRVGRLRVCGRTLKDIDLESKTGVRVIAIRREDDWIFNPGPKTQIEVGDVTLLRGPETGVVDVHPTLTGDPFDPNEPPEPAINDLERAVDSIVDEESRSWRSIWRTALSSFDNEALAEEVSNLEIEVDALQSRFEAWTLRAAQEADDPSCCAG